MLDRFQLNAPGKVVVGQIEPFLLLYRPVLCSTIHQREEYKTNHDVKKNFNEIIYNEK